MSAAALILLSLISVFSALALYFAFRASKKEGTDVLKELAEPLDALDKNLGRIEAAVKDEFARNREEANRNAMEGRLEMGQSLKGFGDSVLSGMANTATLQKNQLETFSNQLNNLTKANEERLEKLTLATEQKLERMRETIEGKLKSLQEDNAAKLEQMRATVDEKLHKTLEERLGQSFKLVSERLELVHKGLGEMQNLAVGVGDLKKVLSNVKTRGILGEIQLGNILEQMLTSDQYDRNVATKKGSRDNVEFAVKLPGRDDSGQVVYLPLDSKFPVEDYQMLIDAHEHGDPAKAEEAGKLLEGDIKRFAKSIRDKYIDPPYTTDFGIMFLPTEGLYAEVIRRPGLFESIQREYKVSITGPTTLSAFLNSIQMGFRTLAIEKRSSEVWKVLGAVKTEFGKFGDVLKKTQENLNRASENIDELVGKRTRQIQRRLKEIEGAPVEESVLLIDDEGKE